MKKIINKIKDYFFNYEELPYSMRISFKNKLPLKINHSFTPDEWKYKKDVGVIINN